MVGSGFVEVLKHYGDRVTREAYLEAAYLRRRPAVLGSECESELPEWMQRWDDEEQGAMMFPVISAGKCHLCGSEGPLYDAGGVMYCERCEGDFLVMAQSYMTEDGHIFRAR